MIEGKKAVFDVAISVKGNPDKYEYQWYRRTSGSNDWIEISGATASEYTYQVSREDHESYYYCKVSNEVGSVRSKEAKLTVHWLPTLRKADGRQGFQGQRRTSGVCGVG